MALANLQDRLRKEMRLAPIDSLEQANRFLETFIPAYNQRFAKAPRDSQSAWCPLHPELELDLLHRRRAQGQS